MKTIIENHEMLIGDFGTKTESAETTQQIRHRLLLREIVNVSDLHHFVRTHLEITA